ncbi:MAG: glycosyltransferase family 2 protein [Rugosibacter sp.]|nr:glycosyltransferase family 2 protein [Rugosibacter sp.]
MVATEARAEPGRFAQELLSVVVPAFNEAAVLPHFHDRLSAVLQELPLRAEIVYVNDGSADATLDVMRTLAAHDGRVALVNLSRNFGKEIALTAGLDHARGEVVVVIDADLQDPPELIAELIRRWREGYDVVYAKRTSRDGESGLKKLTAFAFYRLIQRAGQVRIPQDTGDFRLLSRRAVVALGKLREQHRFMKGLFTWIGYPQVAVPYRRERRYAGDTKWNYWRLWNFALEGITSFTTAPLKLATYFGLVTALVAFAYAVIVVYKTLVFGDPVRGYPSLMVVVLFLGGVQLITIGILGEYIGRMFDETKNRPLYLVEEYRPAAGAGSSPEHSVLPGK